MKTAQDLHKVADDTYPIRMDKINDLVAPESLSVSFPKSLKI